MVSAEPGATLQFHLSSFHDYHQASPVLSLQPGQTSGHEWLHVGPLRTGELALYFTGTVEYEGDPGSRVPVRDNDPRLALLSIRGRKSRTGVSFMELDMRLKLPDGQVLSFTQFYRQNAPEVEAATKQLERQGSRKWEDMLSGPLPPSGYIFARPPPTPKTGW